jgi:homocysteine S-methyltransferase
MFMKRTEHCHIPTLVGILPLRNVRNAEFLSNEVPGMTVPDAILRRLSKAESPDEARATGIEIAQEALLESVPLCQGVYVMPPFNSSKAALQVLDVLPESLRASRTVR